MYASRGGWAADRAELARRQAVAAEMTGATLAAVRYIEIDYVALSVPELQDGGPRQIVSNDEWIAPNWDSGHIHSLDYGVELDTTDGRTFSIGWDTPGRVESMFLVRGPLIGPWLLPTASAAVWDVSRRAPWADMSGHRVNSVVLTYEPWSDDGTEFWCRGLTLSAGGTEVTVVLGEARADGSLAPSADNIAVLLTPDASVDEAPAALDLATTDSPRPSGEVPVSDESR